MGLFNIYWSITMGYWSLRDLWDLRAVHSSEYRIPKYLGIPVPWLGTTLWVCCIHMTLRYLKIKLIFLIRTLSRYVTKLNLVFLKEKKKHQRYSKAHECLKRSGKSPRYVKNKFPNFPQFSPFYQKKFWFSSN